MPSNIQEEKEITGKSDFQLGQKKNNVIGNKSTSDRGNKHKSMDIIWLSQLKWKKKIL
jgi:hypothetical protein